MNSPQNSDESKSEKINFGLITPLVIFVLITLVFFLALQLGGRRDLPSALIGRQVPDFSLPQLTKTDEISAESFDSKDLKKGKVSIVNVWASWCGPCHQEHPYLTALAEQSSAPLFGLNYKDTKSNARRFLSRYGNPYKSIGIDRKGRAAIDWGVYGVPETFIVNGSGRIIYKHVGPISQKDVIEKLLPAIKKARSATSS